MAKTATNPGGRPREFDVDETIAKALDVFWRQGYRATTTRTLEAKLGITQSSLYHAFGSKSQLLALAAHRYGHLVDETLLDPLRRASDGASALQTFVRDLAGWMVIDRRGCLMVNLMVDEAGGDADIAGLTRAHRERVRAAIRQAVLTLDPTVSARTVRSRTDLLLAASLGLNVAARAGATSTEIRQMVSGVQDEIRSWNANPTAA